VDGSTTPGAAAPVVADDEMLPLPAKQSAGGVEQPLRGTRPLRRGAAVHHPDRPADLPHVRVRRMARGPGLPAANRLTPHALRHAAITLYVDQTNGKVPGSQLVAGHAG
jgi:integrase